jgi:hypothetical protein
VYQGFPTEAAITSFLGMWLLPLAPIFTCTVHAVFCAVLPASNCISGLSTSLVHQCLTV